MPQVAGVARAPVFGALDACAQTPGAVVIARGHCSGAAIQHHSGAAQVIFQHEPRAHRLAFVIQNFKTPIPVTDHGVIGETFFQDLRSMPEPLSGGGAVFALSNPAVLAIVLEGPGIGAQGDAGHAVAGIPGVGVATIGQQVALGIMRGGHRACRAVIHASGLAGGIAGGVGGLHGHILHTGPHLGQAFKGAIGIDAGVLAVDGDVSEFIDFAPEPGGAAV